MSPPPGRSILMTRAPKSARRIAALGPARNWLKSRTSNPSSGFIRIFCERFNIKRVHFFQHGVGLSLAHQKSADAVDRAVLEMQITVVTRAQPGVVQRRERAREIIIGHAVV